MRENSAQPKRRRWWKVCLILVAAAVVTSFILLIYINTESFQALVRRRLVAEVERVTGGRVEIGSIHTTPFRMQVDVRGITVHGRESSGEVPLAHIDRIVARLKFNFLLRSELAFSEIILEQPVVHVEFYPDGSSNFPPRRAIAASSQNPVDQLFDFSINHLEIRRGQMFWGDQAVPLDLGARDVSLLMDYSFLHGRYDGRLLVGWVDSKLLKYRPFAWMTAVEFSLTSKAAVIPSLKWNSGHSHFSATGEIKDLRRPHLQMEYSAQVDLAEAASIMRRRDLRGGVAELKGRGDWSLDQFASNGLLTLRDLSWQDDRITLSRASVTSGYSVTDQDLKLSKVQGKILGGSFTGEAELNQWLAPAQHLTAAAKRNLETAVISAAPPAGRNREKPERPKPAAIQSGFILLHLKDLSAEEIAVALNAAAHPLQTLHPAGFASGSLETRWKGTPRDAEVQFALQVNPPAHPAAPLRPLLGRADGIYHAANGSLELPQFTLTTPSSHIQASGTLSSSSALRLKVTTSSLADWLPFMAVVRGPALFPVTLNGSATFNGNMTGSLTSPQLAGALQVEDFDVNIPATARTHEFETQWDSFSTALQLSFDAVTLRKARLTREDTSADFDASATLQHGHLTGDSSFSLRANLSHADFLALQALAGYNYPISGKADLTVQAGGTISDPRGEGKIHLTDALAYGGAIRQFDSKFQMVRGEIAFDDLRLMYDDSTVIGSAAYAPATRSFRLDVTGSNFDLGHIPRLQFGRVAVEGHADFSLKGSGTVDVPALNAVVKVHSLTLDHELSGDLDLQLVDQGGQLHLTGKSQLQQGSFLLSGNVYLGDDYPAKLSVQMDQVDLDALWRSYSKGNLTGHSAVSGSLDLSGPLRHLDQWGVDGALNSIALDVENVKLHNQDEVRFSLANQALNIQQLHMVGEGTDFNVRGSVQLSRERGLDLTADGRIDLKLLSSFDADFSASGLVTMNMTVGGTISEPLPEGHFQLINGSLAYAGLPSGLSELNGSLLFTRDRIHIETLSARTGGGTIDLKGDATNFNQQLNFNLTATGKGVRLRYPPGVSSTADAELHWIGSRSASSLSGDISIDKMAVTPGFDFSAYLERSRQLVGVTAVNSPLNKVKLDIHVLTAPELQMRTASIRLSGDADLRIRGSVGRPAVLGRVDILEGQATFHGTRFTLERGDITFTNPVAIEPQLNLQATTHVRNYDLNITLIGTPSRGLNLNYRAEPPLPKSDIIALLALGRTNQESAQLQEQSGQSVFSDQASNLILNQALNDTASSRFQRLFGASNIKIDPQGLTTETNPTARGPQVTIEQEFANNLSLTYSTNVSQSSQQIIQGEYYFNRNVSVVGTRDQNGVVSFDLRVRRRKK